jgi:hypothetical protein
MDWVALRVVWVRGLFLALLLVSVPRAVAHDTIVPHHLEDVEDLTHARNVRGLALVITIAFVVVLAAVVVLAMRLAPEDADTADVRDEQERLKVALLAAAEVARAHLGDPDGELAREIAAAYGRAVGQFVAPDVSALLGDGQAFGEDALQVRRMRAGESIELCAATATAGARVQIGADGSYSVAVFAVSDSGLPEKGYES